jgi:predicted porin
MKKSLIALAVLAASGAAMAQSSVTLYGVADIWLGSVKTEVNGDSSRETLLESGGVNTSRIGFKGSEDLGGGLKANFQLEQSVALDDGTGGTFDRQSWVGLSGSFGAVQLGRSWSSYDDIRSGANDNFGANVAASFNTWIGYNDRPANSLKYISPEIAGFSGSLTYGLGEDKNKNANGKASSVLSLGAQYANGPIFVGFGHQAEKAGEGTALGALSTINNLLDVIGEPALVAPAGTKVTYNLLNGSYDLGVAKLVGGYNQVKGTTPGVTGSVKANEFNLGVEVPLAANLNLGAGYAQSKIEADGTDLVKTTGFTTTLLYSLSKRTTVYGALSQTKAEDELGLGAKAKTTLYAVGVNHKF